LFYGKAKTKEEAIKAEQRGYEKGYNTINPALRVDELIEKARSPVSAIGEVVADKVAEQAAEMATDYVAGEIKDWFQDPEPELKEKPRRERRNDDQPRRRRAER
jgi:hypothetical protein